MLDRNYGLDIAGDNLPSSNRDNVALWSIGDLPRTQDCFTLTNLGNGYYSIKQMETDMAVDVKGDSTDRFVNIQMFESHSNNNQQWKICYNDDVGGYSLQSKCSGMYLTVEDGVVSNGTNIIQNIKDNNNPKSQAWLLVPLGKEYLLGDTDGDGDVSSIDATYILRYTALMNVDIDEAILMNGDVDGNEELEVVDATYIQRYLAEFPIPYPIGEWV